MSKDLITGWGRYAELKRQFIALREVCHLLERQTAVPGAVWHVANLSETALPDRRSHPTFFICSVLTAALCTNVLHGSLQSLACHMPIIK